VRQNVTIAVEQDLLRKARVLAAKRGTSVSRLLAEELARLVDESERYDRAKAAALDEIDAGLRLGGKPAARDTLHDR
jgi:predicted transcriptional regulator